MLRREAQKMLMELESSRLEVVLIPSKFPDCAMRGGMIRAVQESNTRWYRDFCSQYTCRRKKLRRKRKHDTMIKREWTIKGLGELIRGRCETSYAHRLADFIEHRK
jgi:hypothetical protein